MKLDSEIKKLSDEIKASQKILIALGDEMRQHLILTMMKPLKRLSASLVLLNFVRL